jgi:hypothetical protein
MADFTRSRDSDVRVSLLMFALAVGSTVACQQAPKTEGYKEIVPAYNAQTGRLERISYDRNKDGKQDAWLYMDGTRAIRAELDENDDGAIDRWEYYRTDVPASSGPSTPRGELVRAEQAMRFDGKVSRWESYDEGRLAKVQQDTTGDGRPDKWEVWTGGSLAEVALDTKGTGKPDRRIVYPTDGGTPQLLVDDKGDGTFHPVIEP